MPKTRKLTVAQLLKKFPDWSEPNENCLEDIACPNCGNRYRFGIVGTTKFDVQDDGSSGNEGDHEWDENSITSCDDCRHAGVLSDFTFEGLDAELERLLNE